MRSSEANELLDGWELEKGKVFEYRGHWFDQEMLVIFKKGDDLFEVDWDKSTLKEGPYNRSDFYRLLVQDLLIEKPYQSIHSNYKEERTGGCTCGSWRLGKDYPHDFNCRKYYKW